MRAGASERVNILLVEDQRERRLRYEAALHGLGENLLEATSSAAAVKLLRRTDVAVVLADARRNHRNGVDLARTIHGRLGLRDTSVLLACNARALPRERREPRSTGIVEFVADALVPERLRARMRVHLELFRSRRREQRLREERTGHLRRYEAELQHIARAAAHDLQEPLRSASSFVRLLAKHHEIAADPQAQSFARFAVDGIEQLNDRITALGTYAGIHVDGSGMTTCDCADALERALENLRPALRASGAELTRGALPVLHADATQIALLFQNLIANAIQFRRADVRPAIRVEAVRTGAEWLFSVRDNGIGIEPEHRERIFLLYRRLHSRDAHPGTGLGLALCHKIAANHGGRIWVESTAGQGSAFHFTLPMPPKSAERRVRRASKPT